MPVVWVELEKCHLPTEVAVSRLLKLTLLLLILSACSRQEPAQLSADGATDVGGEITVYRAREIITMDAVRPRAEVIAVQDGRIAAVGNMLDVQRALAGQPYTFDDRFFRARPNIVDRRSFA